MNMDLTLIALIFIVPVFFAAMVSFILYKTQKEQQTKLLKLSGSLNELTEELKDLRSWARYKIKKIETKAESYKEESTGDIIEHVNAQISQAVSNLDKISRRKKK